MTFVICGCTEPSFDDKPVHFSISEEDTYGNGKGIEMLVGIDSLGRTVSLCGEKKTDKKIGMFYWIWHGTYTDKIIDMSKIIERFGADYALHNVKEYNENLYPHWWGEPLFGYYNSADPYIIRKHLTLLMYAGVDFICFDVSNTLTYPMTVRKISKIICEMREEGFMVPQMTFYTHTASIDTVKKLYKEVFTHPEYEESWYKIDGKPLMIAQTDVEKDRDRTSNQHAHLKDYSPAPLSDEIMNFFYFRTPAWVGQDKAEDNTWPWIDWYYPPELHGNLMCVSVSSHHWTKYSWMAVEKSKRPTTVWNQGKIAWGRGYDVENDRNIAEDVVKGTYYQSVWDAVIKADPEIAFISGWNEFTCGVEYNPEYDIYETYDSFDMEFSRDIEMIKGGYGDNFLLETAMNTKLFGYNVFSIDDYEPAKDRTIDIGGPVSQWDNVPATYFATGSTNYGRDYKDATNIGTYFEEVPVNAVQMVKIASDRQNVYFLVKCDKTPELGNNRLNFLIGRGTPSLKGWNGYEYLVGRVADGGKMSVETIGEDFNPKAAGECSYVICEDGYIQIAISRKDLGMNKTSDSFYFKLADSVSEPSDIMSYYTSGRCMPMGRFSYQYIGNN